MLPIAVAVAGLWLSHGPQQRVRAEMISGAQHEHHPVVAIMIWVWGGGHRLCHVRRRLLDPRPDGSVGLPVALLGIWAAVAL